MVKVFSDATGVPPVAVVYQLIVTPVTALAVKVADEPGQTVTAFVVITGLAGMAFTVTVTFARSD